MRGRAHGAGYSEVEGFPFNVNSSGSEPTSPEAMNPNVRLPPAAMVALCFTFTTDTAWPDWVTVPFHRLPIFSVPLNENRRSQPLIAVEPVLVIHTWVFDPFGQVPCTVYETWQVCAA